MSATTSVVTGVDFVFVPTTDFAAAEEFYGTALGLPCSARYGKVPGGEFETGNLTLQVIESEAIGRQFEPSRSPIALHVDGVAGSRADLEALGLAFSGATIDTSACPMAGI